MGEATNYFYDLPDDLQFNIYKELHKIYQTEINKITEDAFSKANALYHNSYFKCAKENIIDILYRNEIEDLYFYKQILYRNEIARMKKRYNRF